MTRVPPMLAGGLPGLGHLVEFVRNPIGLMQKGRDRHGDVFSVRVPGKTVHVLTGPAAQEAFFRARDDQLSSRPVLQITVPILGRGIAFDAAPEVMEEQLSFVLPALRDARMQTYAAMMAEETGACLAAWGDEGEVELHEVTNRLTTLISTRCLLGSEFRGQVSSDFVQWYRDLKLGVSTLALLNPYLPLPAFRRRDRARARIAHLISGIMADRRRGQKSGEDFLQTLMEAHYRDGRPLPDDHVTGLLLAVIFAGQFQSASLSAATVTHLIQHPHYLERVLDEQASILGSPPVFTLERLKRMVVLDNAIKETGRLSPPTSMVPRRVMQDFVHGDFILAEGSMAVASARIGHRIPEVFKDPNRYDPDRFGPGREEDRQAPYCLITFGGGKHRCLGMAFAVQQIKVIVSVLLNAYRLEVAGPGRIRYSRRSTTPCAAPEDELPQAGGCPRGHA